MIRARTWLLVGMTLGGVLVAGTILAQVYQPPATASTKSGDRPASQVYNPVAAETLGIVSSAQQLRGAFVKVADVFFEEVTVFPNDALNAGITPDKYYAFRTRPDGSDLLCFVPLDNPDVAALKAAGPPRGAQIFIMGQVGNRVFVGGSGATTLAVDRVFLGNEEPRSKAAERKPVVITIERFGPAGNIVKQEFTIEKPGQRYLIHDAADPQNAMRDIYITLQF
jgi:hypothetical protein